MLRDPEEYADPDAFIPERFMPKEGERMPRDPGKIAYGYGRRWVSRIAFKGLVLINGLITVFVPERSLLRIRYVNITPPRQC